VDAAVFAEVLVLDAGDHRQLGGGDDLAQLLAVLAVDVCERTVDVAVQVVLEAGRGDGVHLQRDALATPLDVLEGRVLDVDQERFAHEEVGLVAGHRWLTHHELRLQLGHSRRHT